MMDNQFNRNQSENSETPNRNSLRSVMQRSRSESALCERQCRFATQSFSSGDIHRSQSPPAVSESVEMRTIQTNVFQTPRRLDLDLSEKDFNEKQSKANKKVSVGIDVKNMFNFFSRASLHQGVHPDPKSSSTTPTSASVAISPRKESSSIPLLRFFRHGKKCQCDQINQWKISFENLLHDPHGLYLFHCFLKTEFSEENILFWRACEAYKNLQGNKKLIKEAQKISHLFLSPQAPHEVNLDSKTREQAIQNLLKSPSKHSLDAAQKKIEALMEKDSYPRFLRSQFFLNATKDSGDCHDAL